MFFACYGLDSDHTNKHLALQQLLDEVAERNPDLAAANARVQAATFVIDRVSTPSDPLFTWMTDYNAFSPPKDDLFPDSSYQLAQTFPFPGKLHLKGKIAQQQLTFTRYEKITTLRELILKTKKLYYQLSFNYVAQSINKNNREIVSSIIKGALALYKTGKARQEEVFKAKIEYAILKNELLVLHSELISIKAILNAFLNRPPTEHIAEPNNFFHPKFNLSYDALEIIAMRERSELHGVQAMIEEQKITSRLARLEFFPDVTVAGTLHDMKDSHNHGWGINISFNIPLFYSRRQRRESQEANARALAYHNTLEGMRAMIRGQIKEFLAKIEASEKLIMRYEKKILPTTLQTLSASQEKYRVGKGEFLFLLDTRRQLQNFQLAYEQARTDRELLLADLERVIGMPLEKLQSSI